MAAVKGGHRFLQGEGRRCAGAAVMDPFERFFLRGFECRQGGRDDRGGMVNWWIDDAVMVLGMAPTMDKQGVFLHRPGRFRLTLLKEIEGKKAPASERYYAERAKAIEMPLWRP